MKTDRWLQRRIEVEARAMLNGRDFYYDCPECGKPFEYRKHCENHCRECAGGEPFRIDLTKEIADAKNHNRLSSHNKSDSFLLTKE